jgi:methylphosphotriester-DNA--protein-cysteine methyltransferase
MVPHSWISTKELHHQIRDRRIQFAGCSMMKIYGLLNCRSGKRMRKENRVFFVSQEEAKENDYRPCGNCMRTAYVVWKNSNKRVG